MGETKIKPCPFCEKKVIIAKDNHDKVLIECENCKLFFGIEVENGTELIEGWKATFDSVGGARMKAVLLSIQPKWCGLIASGKKTLEVRKTKSKIKTPFKVYIYCTKDRNNHFWTGARYSYADERSHNAFDKDGNGKVIGEFVCDEIITFPDECLADWLVANSCITSIELERYAGSNGNLYAWHISELVIYDDPKPIERFRNSCRYRNTDNSCQWSKVECECVKFDHNPDGSVNLAECCDYMSRPPQSWCYVEVNESD